MSIYVCGMCACESVYVCGFVVGHKALRAVVDGRQSLIVMDNDVRRDKNTAHKIFMCAFFCPRTRTRRRRSCFNYNTWRLPAYKAITHKCLHVCIEVQSAQKLLRALRMQNLISQMRTLSTTVTVTVTVILIEAEITVYHVVSYCKPRAAAIVLAASRLYANICSIFCFVSLCDQTQFNKLKKNRAQQAARRTGSTNRTESYETEWPWPRVSQAEARNMQKWNELWLQLPPATPSSSAQKLCIHS